MKAKILIKIAGQSIVKNKMRTLLTMLGIIIGVAAVNVMVAIGSGAQRQIERQIQALGTNMLVFTPGSAVQGGVSQGAQTCKRLTIYDDEKLRSLRILLSSVSPIGTPRYQHIRRAGVCPDET